jgi:hypothetical protein
MEEEKKLMEGEILQELREIRAKYAERFATEEEELAYWKERDKQLQKDGWKLVTSPKKKLIRKE